MATDDRVAAQMSPLDRLATWWLVRRGRLLDLKPRPLRIEIPSNLSAEEAEQLREEWTRLHVADRREARSAARRHE